MLNHAAHALHIVKQTPKSSVVLYDIPLQYPLPNDFQYPTEFVEGVPFVGFSASPELLIYGLKVLDTSIFRADLFRHDSRVTFLPEELPFLESCYIFDFMDQLCSKTAPTVLQKTVYAYEDTRHVFDRSGVITDRAGAVLAGIIRYVGDLIKKVES